MPEEVIGNREESNEILIIERKSRDLGAWYILGILESCRNLLLRGPCSNSECVRSPLAGKPTPFRPDRNYCKCVQDREPLLEGTLAFPCKLASKCTVQIAISLKA